VDINIITELEKKILKAIKDDELEKANELIHLRVEIARVKNFES